MLQLLRQLTKLLVLLERHNSNLNRDIQNMISQKLSIELGVAHAMGSSKSSRGRRAIDQLDPETKQQILERDDFVCQCCGFRSLKYQDLVPRNSNLHDTRLDNLATTCVFCQQCFYLDRVTQMRSGFMVWLPEIEQADLHHIARAIYVARISQGPMADMARSALDLLMTRRESAKERLGTDDPFVLANVLNDYLGPKHYGQRSKKLDGVRLFPLDRRIIKEADLEFNQFPQILAYWRSKDGPFGGKIPTKWLDIYKDIMWKKGCLI